MDQHHWIFLSPHFDDVALSCGGLVWNLSQQGDRIEIWTIMGGFPPDNQYSDFAEQMHQEWGTSGRETILIRRAEDQAACQVLGAQPRHFPWPDAIYRRDNQSGKHIVKDNQTLFNEQPEDALLDELLKMLEEQVPEDAKLVCPMGLGNHIDHRTVHLSLKQSALTRLFYADYPYILNNFANLDANCSGYVKLPLIPSQDSLKAWQDAVLCYGSQLSMFWRDEQETRLALRNYIAGGGGRLWQRKKRRLDRRN